MARKIHRLARRPATPSPRARACARAAWDRRRPWPAAPPWREARSRTAQATLGAPVQTGRPTPQPPRHRHKGGGRQATSPGRGPWRRHSRRAITRAGLVTRIRRTADDRPLVHPGRVPVPVPVPARMSSTPCHRPRGAHPRKPRASRCTATRAARATPDTRRRSRRRLRRRRRAGRKRAGQAPARSTATARRRASTATARTTRLFPSGSGRSPLQSPGRAHRTRGRGTKMGVIRTETRVAAAATTTETRTASATTDAARTAAATPARRMRLVISARIAEAASILSGATALRVPRPWLRRRARRRLCRP